MAEIILASASPRRREILKQIGIRFKVVPSSADENIENCDDTGLFVEKLAWIKAWETARRMPAGHLVIGADTIVLSGEGIMGKPKDKDEAFKMLKYLSGKTHTVLTGVTVIEARTDNSLTSHERTEVTFRDITEDEIRAYIDTGEPMDKAGAYGIQGRGAVFVEKIDGCYFNVMGLPVSRLCLMLKKFGIEVFGQADG